MKHYYLKFKLKIGLLLLFCCWSTLISAANRQSDIVEYVNSGRYLEEISQSLLQAKQYLDIQIRNRKHAKLALVLDIDETALSNYENLKRIQFTKHPEAIASAYLLANSPAIPPVLALYEYALNHQVAVFFITERPNTPEIATATIVNLKQAGYTEWEDIYMRPVSNDQLSNADFKMHARRDIINKGYEIILTLDDGAENVKGGYTESKAILPNPFV